MPVKTIWNRLLWRQKVLAVALLVLLVVAGIEYFSKESIREGGTAPAPPVVNSREAVSGQPPVTVRDPFIPPPGFALPAPPSAAPSPAIPAPRADRRFSGMPENLAAGASQSESGGRSKGTGPAIREEEYTLTGIVEAGSSRSPIIRSGNQSRSYSLGEQVGTYQIVEIGDHSVTLQGPNGCKVLTVK